MIGIRPALYSGLLMATPIQILCPHLTPYNDFLFRKIAEAHPQVRVRYRNKALGSHPWQSNLGEGYQLDYERRALGIDWQTLALAFTSGRTFFLVAGWDSLTMLVMLSLLRLFGRSYAIWTDTPNPDRRGNWLKERLRSAWLRWILAGAKGCLGTGSTGVAGLRKMGAPERTLVTFPFVLDLDLYRRGPRGSEASRPMRFVSSGRVQNWLKGHDVAVKAFMRIASSDSMNFEYFVAGTGPDKEALERLVQEADLASKIKFLGWVEPGDLQRLLKESDVVIHPSPVPDPFPNAVLEGMAAGCAVLGSSVCGSVVDRVVEGVSGFVHAPGDVQQLEGHIRSCILDPVRVAKMGDAAAATAERWPSARAVAIVCELAEGRFPSLANTPWPAK
jgi:glycosyltransferase involved in cell wall biosynthesis